MSTEILTGTSAPGEERCAACDALLIDGVGLLRMPVAPYTYVIGYEKIIYSAPHPTDGTVTTVTAHPIVCTKPECLEHVFATWPNVDIGARRAATIEALAQMHVDAEKYEAEAAERSERRDAASQKLQAAWVRAGNVLGFEPGAHGFTNLLKALVARDAAGMELQSAVLEELRLATLEYESTWCESTTTDGVSDTAPAAGELTATGLCTVGMHPEPLPRVTHAVTIRDGSIPVFKCCAACAAAYQAESGDEVRVEELTVG